jgi:cell division protein FtsA
VAQSDVEEAIASACDSVPLTSDRRILQHTVREFVLDGERGIKRPLGMVGRQLDVDLHVVTGRGSVVDNLVACVEAAGVSVAAECLEAQATAIAVLTDAEQRLGCVLLDIGGGTTDLAVFTQGAICHTSALHLAGNAATMDVAKVLRLAPEEAERLKRAHGHALADEVPEDEEVEATLVGTGEEAKVSRRLLAQVIQARMEEILEALGGKLTAERLWALAPAGVVLSGGGSELPGMARLATAVLRGLPARIGAPRDVKDDAGLVREPLFATGVGLAKLAAADEAWCSRRAPRAARAAGAVPAVRGPIGKAWQRALELLHRFHAQRR